jgi:hypothetical protein
MHVSKKEDRPGGVCRGGEGVFDGQPGTRKKLRTGFSQKWGRCGKKITQKCPSKRALECNTDMTPV